MSSIPESALIAIPNKHYFTIGEVSGLFSIEPHVLRYWEQEFAELKPVRRRGRRRYYTRREVELIHSIIDLLYDKEYTISGARKQLKKAAKRKADNKSDIKVSIDQTIETLNHALNILSSQKS